MCWGIALGPVWPDWAIYWTLRNFLKTLILINLPKSSPFLGNFCKGVKIYHFSSEINFGQLLQTFCDFFLVTLIGAQFSSVLLYQKIEYKYKNPTKSTTLVGRYQSSQMFLKWAKPGHLFLFIFVLFLNTNKVQHLTIKSVNGMLGIRTRDHRMVGISYSGRY